MTVYYSRDKNGRKLAYRWRGGRNFRVALDAAEMAEASGERALWFVTEPGGMRRFADTEAELHKEPR